MARQVLDIAAQHVKPGVTTDEIDRVVHEETIKRNAYPSPLNYHGFPKSCCTSVCQRQRVVDRITLRNELYDIAFHQVNEVICHGIPDQRPLEDGDIVNIDVTLYFDGFHGDLNETYLCGNVDEEGRKLVDGTRKCLEEGGLSGVCICVHVCVRMYVCACYDVVIAHHVLSPSDSHQAWYGNDCVCVVHFVFSDTPQTLTVRPGTRYRELGDIIQKIATQNGHSVVKTYCGHGMSMAGFCTFC